MAGSTPFEKPSRAKSDRGARPPQQSPVQACEALPAANDHTMGAWSEKAAAIEADSDAPYQNLPPRQADVLKRQVLTPELRQGVKAMYRLASRNDALIMSVAALGSILSGAGIPLMTVILGGVQGVFENYWNHVTDQNQFHRELVRYVLYFVYLGIAEFITTYIATVGFTYAGERITNKIREEYLRSCLRQNIAFFDTMGTGEITTRITAQTNLIQDGISQKASLTLIAVSAFITAFVIGFIYYWKLTLILSSAFFALVINMGVGGFIMTKNSQAALQAYAEGGNLAEGAISSIRNTVAMGIQERLAERYDEHLKRAERFGARAKTTLGTMIATIMLIMFLNQGLAFWQGSKYLVEGIITLAQLLTIYIALMTGEFNVGNIAPYVQAFTSAVSASSTIFDTIDRQSPIDYSHTSGSTLPHISGSLRFESVKHIYPSRPEVEVLKSFTLDIPAGRTTALVGSSGSGKSTVVGLVERFYNPVEGQIFLDGHDITTLNLRGLRRQMALVSQEPVLFRTTVFENIRYGLLNSEFEASESQEQQRERIYSAAKKANAHDFITTLPEGYDTNVGDSGILLSGGQRQRIAIARAIVSEPQILFLDEATSALDTKSEGVVQAALKAAAAGRTTITIAHRLSTIREADNIVVMSNGEIIEQGTHQELVAKKAAYFGLLSTQNMESRDQSAPKDHVEDVTDSWNGRDLEILRADDDWITKQKDTRDVDHKGQSDELQRIFFASAAPGAGNKIGDVESLNIRGGSYGWWTLSKLIMSLNAPEWKLMTVGFVFCIVCGGSQPAASVLFAKQISVLDAPITDANRHQVRQQSNFFSAMYVMLAVALFIAYTVPGATFAKASERLVHRLRSHAFRAMLRQDVEFFDQEESSAGSLTSFLSTETTHAAGLSGSTLGTLLTSISTLVSSCALALAVGWKLALVCISTVPVLLACGFFRVWTLAHFERRSKAAYVKSAALASEAVAAIRTVAALTREEDVVQQYRHSLVAQQQRSLKSLSKSGLLFAGSESFIYLCLALGFWYGGILIGEREYSEYQFFLCFMVVFFGTQATGVVFSLAPDMGKAHSAAYALKALFDRKPVVDTRSDKGQPLKELVGTVEFRDVYFRYPTRPNHPVFQGLNLTVRPNQHVALVGPSGSGKSTVTALLERFYDPQSGAVFVDGHDISTLNVNRYRSLISLVSQEPSLYQGTIRENIRLGSLDDDVSEEAIEAACREANAYDFIISLPDGFNTMVGSKGALLSGGQKQRIAIARALIRNPRILLLDEATSALDSESEQAVQVALDRAAKHRTTVSIAHRLSTIQNADVIYVLDQGRVAEAGTHAELMKENGIYAEMVRLQSVT